MIPGVLCPLLTPAGSAEPLGSGCQFLWRVRQASPGKNADLPPAPASYTPPLLGSLGFRCVAPAHPNGAASYEVLVHRTVGLPPASFGFRLAADTLAFG
ncbi:hypothetical protein CVV65_12775 [Kyrpidia spormannii]|uniref:Uncharacterized protein n=1 Tax=Kyrpidia spormannii TaxID=2055160 RepID=A0A2K8N8P3_9BACL|nr:hypothetical protein CVV65_06185 [Kyrpidia spormannii]ATY85479.1 hypothetical protein CVV65_11520 [Kyrpidia spormannii]ATY85485.1 hypothetical protein CVV65_11555 [Kyrpidia spormannii]ATY85690.1 hypothetical protein CVV65_12775 [Kyrpidia spormannii]